LKREKPSLGRRGYLALATMVATAVAMVIALPAFALDTTVFELDGNATTDHAGIAVPDDWDRVCRSFLGTDCSTTNIANTSTVEFASQGASTGTTFTGGGSKDPIDVSSWAWNQATGGLPGKDILLNGFAAEYTTSPNANCPGSVAATTCKQIFFGMDRFDNSGDAQNGFWFFQNQINLGSAKSGGGQSFTGVHMNGDLLIVSDFSIGGTMSTVNVYTWDNACTAAGKPFTYCADTNLHFQGGSTSANCASAASTAAFCGIVNPTAGTTAPWPFTDKKGNTSFDQGEFYEGGIDLSSFGLANECFASTLAESRASTSTSATLKSFVLGGFGACGSALKTTPQDASGGGIAQQSVSITTAGSIKVQDQAAVTVTGVSVWNGSVAFYLCGPADLAIQPSCISGGTSIGSVSVSNSSPACSSPPGAVCVTSAQATITSAAAAAGAAPFNYCWRGVFTSTTTGVPGSTDDTSTECFTVTPVTPTLTTSATIVSTSPFGDSNLPATISDTATLALAANEPGTGGPGNDKSINPATAGSPAKGNITFTAYGPNSCATVAMVATTVPVNGNGTYGVSFTPTLPGTYTFVASYSGDPPNTNGVPTSACPDTTGTEAVTARDTSSVQSAQTWTPQDSATVTSGSTNASLNGTLKLELFGSSDCSGIAIQTYTTNVTGASTASVTSGNQTTYVVSGTGTHTVSWLVTFTSTDSNVSGSSHCEKTTVTITD